MNPYKKLMAVLLCIVLCVSLLPASAFAEAGLAEEPVEIIEEDLVIEENDEPALCGGEEPCEEAPAEEHQEENTAPDLSETPSAQEANAERRNAGIPTIQPETVVDVVLHGRETPEVEEDRVSYQFVPDTSGNYSLCKRRLSGSVLGIYVYSKSQQLIN